ncbi:MAG: KOW domain-containing RNA-binding protein [Defluviitaleaceae bacterium]|nr:KOW domain-containing RNA-binding protein [Defluviitaleaceae bacterium]
MTLNVGQVVFAKCGRDKGKAFIVQDICEDYLYLVDGKLRTLDAPKKKKAKHVQPTGYVADLKTDGRMLQDADIRKALTAYLVEGGRTHCQKTMS